MVSHGYKSAFLDIVVCLSHIPIIETFDRGIWSSLPNQKLKKIFFWPGNVDWLRLKRNHSKVMTKQRKSAVSPS